MLASTVDPRLHFIKKIGITVENLTNHIRTKFSLPAYEPGTDVPLKTLKKVGKYVQNLKKWNLAQTSFIEKTHVVEKTPVVEKKPSVKQKRVKKKIYTKKALTSKALQGTQRVDSYFLESKTGRKRAFEKPVPASKALLRREKKKRKVTHQYEFEEK